MELYTILAARSRMRGFLSLNRLIEIVFDIGERQNAPVIPTLKFSICVLPHPIPIPHVVNRMCGFVCCHFEDLQRVVE